VQSYTERAPRRAWQVPRSIVQAEQQHAMTPEPLLTRPADQARKPEGRASHPVPAHPLYQSRWPRRRAATGARGGTSATATRWSRMANSALRVRARRKAALRCAYWGRSVDAELREQRAVQMWEPVGRLDDVLRGEKRPLCWYNRETADTMPTLQIRQPAPEMIILAKAHRPATARRHSRESRLRHCHRTRDHSTGAGQRLGLLADSRCNSALPMMKACDQGRIAGVAKFAPTSHWVSKSASARCLRMETERRPGSTQAPRQPRGVPR